MDYCGDTVRLNQIEKLEDGYLRCHRASYTALLRIPDIDYPGQLVDCRSLLFDPCLQFLGRATQHVVPACLQLAPNIGVCADRGNVRSNSVSQRFGQGLTTKNSRQPLDFKFGMTKFANGLEVGQCGGATWVCDGKKARLSGLNGRG